MTDKRMAEKLLAKTGASRTTIRMGAEDGTLELVAEALAPGVKSMRDGPTSRDIEVAETYEFLKRERAELIQNDCRHGHPAPPPSLVGHFEVYAQMLAPIVVGDEMVGTISVHQVGNARRWRDSDVSALRDLRAQIEAELSAGRAPRW